MAVMTATTEGSIGSDSDQLDFVYEFYGMHEVLDRERVIRELCDLIKPGGDCFLDGFRRNDVTARARGA